MAMTSLVGKPIRIGDKIQIKQTLYYFSLNQMQQKQQEK